MRKLKLIAVYVFTGISHLLPYVIPHIIKKWQLLATALGLSQEDIASITVAPHEKQSRCADMVLQKWLVKDKSRATRQKLVNALKEIDARKALGMYCSLICHHRAAN